MSSWAVLTMMGIYSVDPASLAYELVSPSFSKIVIHLGKPYPGATFTITTTEGPDANPYIQTHGPQWPPAHPQLDWVQRYHIRRHFAFRPRFCAQQAMGFGAGGFPAFADRSA